LKKAKPESEKVRLSLDVTPEIRDQLESLKARSSATNLTEVFRRSLALFDLVTDLIANKGKVILENPDGTRENLRIL